MADDDAREGMEDLARFLAAIVAASGEEDFMERVLAALDGTLGLRQGIFALGRREDGTPTRRVVRGLPSIPVDRYWAVHDRELYARVAAEAPELLEKGVVGAADLERAFDFRSTPYVRRFMAPNGFDDCLFLVLGHGEPWTGIVHLLGRPGASTPLSLRAELLALARPVLEAALRLHLEHRAHRDAVRSYELAFQRLDRAVLVDTGGAEPWANNEARRIAANKFPEEPDGGIARLAAALAAAAPPAGPGGRRSGFSWEDLAVGMDEDPGLPFAPGAAPRRVFRLGLPPRDEAALAGSLASRRGLTAREAEVLALAAEGEDDEEMARRLGLSYNTVRSHLQRVYRKLGVSGRTALLKALREAR